MYLPHPSPPPILSFLRQVWWLLSAFLGLFHRRRSSNSRLLTEDEYREQAERHTRASLEELRRYCTNPGFPAWDTVLRLRAPQRYAVSHTCTHTVPQLGLLLQPDWSERPG